MNSLAYSMIEPGDDSNCFVVLNLGVIRAEGRDCHSFLQGQLSNDIHVAKPGSFQHTCLLNNTGHLVADIQLAETSDSILMLTDFDRSLILSKTLDRFVVRERAEFKDLTEEYCLFRIFARKNTSLATELDVYAEHNVQFIGSTNRDMEYLVPMSTSGDLETRLKEDFGFRSLAEAEVEERRIEQGIPKWGAELDESVIPLEAGFLDAISYSKGCYMGQEIIARIHSRGHTNRTMVGLQFKSDGELPIARADLLAVDGVRAGDKIGWITSLVRSPRCGGIGLGFVRNDYATSGTVLSCGNGNVLVARLPQ